MFSTKVRVRRRVIVNEFPFPLKKTPSKSQFVNSFQKLVLQIAELGDAKALDSIGKQIKDPKLLRLSPLVAQNKYIDKNLIKRLEGTVLQQRGIPARDIETAATILKNAKQSVVESQKKHSQFVYSTAKSFGVPVNAVRKIATPPFYQIGLVNGSSIIPAGEIGSFHMVDKRVNFMGVRQAEHVMLPSQPKMSKRLYDLNRDKNGAVGIAYNGLTITRTMDNEKVLIVDNIQTFPRTKRIEEIVMKESFPEYRDYQKILLIDALRTAQRLGIKKVFLPHSETMMFEPDKETKNIALARDKLGKEMKGKESSIPLDVDGKVMKVRGFVWNKK